MDMLSLYTSEELSEMLYLRRQIEELQKRYDAIANKAAKPGQGHVTVAPPPPTPVAPAFTPAPVPVMTPVPLPFNPAPAPAPVAYAPAPTPVPAPVPYAQPVMQPAMPVMPAPIPQMQAPAAPQPHAGPAMKPHTGGAAKPKTASSPFFKPGAGPIPKPGGQKTFQSPIAIPGMKQGAPQAAQSVSSSSYQKIREYAVSALSQAGKPLTFDKLFEKISVAGCPLPSDKPKVVVRKVLCNSPDVFSVTNKGLYTIVEGYVPQAPVPAKQPVQEMPAAPVMQPAPQPVYQQPVQPVIAMQPAMPVQQVAPPQPMMPSPQPIIQQQPIIQKPDPTAQPSAPAPVQPPQPVIQAHPAKAAPEPAPVPPRKPAVPAMPPPPAPPLDTVTRKAITSSGTGSIRERATTVIMKADRPLSLDEIFEKMKVDGFPLPPHNAKDIVKTVLNNRNLFQFVENGRYLPVKEQA